MLRENGRMQIENLCQQVEMPISKLVSHLFNLEMKGAVRTLPGKVYEWLAQ
jgi:predicted Rossmann fold nucleotide-binding protein DprA/Smf involved in DNA uptake